ncbi:hypothetical protein M408DRAFT_326165 [Serendipita vermifera MAFF 305830]|uniref:Uncharacterized protein n=1 Tax=Serendipita vermifera MAFF 305830 TaxID=933852 RepID=A0A0C3BPR5_SERVB|nr:hypothetical protein M408DRAFT_326165 [Serendipita vermifera MAFF 305830]
MEGCLGSKAVFRAIETSRGLGFSHRAPLESMDDSVQQAILLLARHVSTAIETRT